MVEGVVSIVLDGTISSVVGIYVLTAAVAVDTVAEWKWQSFEKQIPLSRKGIVMHVKAYLRG